MLSIVATVGWILFDVYFCLRTTSNMSNVEWWTLLIGGVGLGLIALAGEIRDRTAHSRDIANLTKGQEIHSTEHLALAKGEIGLFERLAVIAAAVQQSSTLTDWQNTLTQLHWFPLTSEQKARLRNALSKLQRGKLAIAYHGDEDCEYLAHDLEQVFLDVGWTLAENTGSIESSYRAWSAAAGIVVPSFAWLPLIRVPLGITVIGFNPSLLAHDIRDSLNDILSSQATSSIVSAALAQESEVATINLVITSRRRPPA